MTVNARDPDEVKEAVPDQRTAERVAEAVLAAAYGESKIRSEKPFRVELSNGVWYVRGSLPYAFRLMNGKGGVAKIAINASDGRVIFIQHGK